MSNRRLALNTAATYTRSVIAIGFALFSSRWVLNALGQTDFGLFSVVGSLILFITFLNNLLSGSTARHYAFSIGQGDPAEVNCWFNASLSIHLCLALALVLAGWPIGQYVVAYVLKIPPARLDACLWVFRISLASAFASMLSVPFVAMFTAKQHISELAAWGIVQSALAFTLAFLLRYAPGDRLFFFAAGTVAIIVLVQAAQILRALRVFEECRVDCGKWFDRDRLREIFSFAGWNLFGWAGVLFRDQGSAILLNLFFGANVNAAYGIASQVSTQTNQLSAAMLGAFSPEVTACEGRGDRERMLSLSQRASKFGTILVLLFAVPLIVEMHYVLKLWLGTPPPYTELFCQLILAAFLVDRLSVGYMLAVNAHGRIAGYQATVGTILLLTLPLSWVFLKLGLAPTSIGVAFICTMTVTSLGRVLWGRRLFGIPVARWFGSVVWPCALVALLSTAAALVPYCLLPSSFARLALVTAASALGSLLVSWYLALDDPERGFVAESARKFSSRLGRRSQVSCP
jgi:O-antigen/teichoic acid export membrane protein